MNDDKFAYGSGCWARRKDAGKSIGQGASSLPIRNALELFQNYSKIGHFRHGSVVPALPLANPNDSLQEPLPHPVVSYHYLNYKCYVFENSIMIL